MIEQISIETMIVVLVVFTYFALWTSALRRVYTCRELGKQSSNSGKEGAIIMFSWVYHGKNRRQCYYRPNCLVCYAKLVLKLVFRGES